MIKELLYPNNGMCGIAVNSSTAFIFSKQREYNFDINDHTISYNIKQNKWRFHTKPPLTHYPELVGFTPKCALYQSKDYKRYLMYLLSRDHLSLKIYVQFVSVNRIPLLNKPYVSGVTFKE